MQSIIKWNNIEDKKPERCVSVLAHMTDAEPFPAVREAYRVDGEVFFFPALNEHHPIDRWAEMPEE